MSRYLNEGAVWSAVKRIPHITTQTRQAILEALRKVPSAHVAEVVICRECKHYNPTLGYCNIHSYYCDSKGNSCRSEDSLEYTINHVDVCVSNLFHSCKKATNKKRRN